MEVISKEETIIKSIYKTSDGQEFTCEVDAEYHESHNLQKNSSDTASFTWWMFWGT